MKIISLGEEINQTQIEINAIFARIIDVNSNLDRARAELNSVIADKKKSWARKEDCSAELLKITKKK